MHQSYSQGYHMTYLAPLKLAVVDEEGTMRLHYWPKNDLMKGPKLPAEQLALLPPLAASTASGGERIISTALDNRNGTVLEGKLPTCGGGAIIFKGGMEPPAPPAPPPAPPHYKPVPNIRWVALTEQCNATAVALRKKPRCHCTGKRHCLWSTKKLN